MSKIIAKIKGPFNLVGKNNLFQSKESNSSGIYFFTFKINGKIYIEYVGITTRNFNIRFVEHMKELMSGGYQLYDFKKLKNNCVSVIWKGRYGKDTDNINIFLNNYKNKFSKSIYEHIKNFSIYLIPLNNGKRLLERIEGEIYKLLRLKNDNITSTFVKGVRSNPRRSNEESINFEILNNPLSSEIPNKFKI